MLGFAERTGIADGRPPRRYLWTDAFAVCNFLALARATGEQRYQELALRLAGQVHHVLGRHRPDDARRGWISGLGESEGEAHPTRGGLRIGKPLPERAPDAPFDAELEWERDGQYFHYLTKWMHALDQLGRATREPRFNAWARELDAAAYAVFVVPRQGRRAPRMCWKMSIDLSRALVPSMGQHDPLDGLVTSLELRASAVEHGSTAAPDLAEEVRGFASIAAAGGWETADPLGIGGLLCDAFRLFQLARAAPLPEPDMPLRLLDAASAGLDRCAEDLAAPEPAEHRLAFRELGLAIGLQAVGLMGDRCGAADAALRAAAAPLLCHLPLGAGIEAFWREPAHRRSRAWLEHRDINEVMLATQLLPEGFLLLAPAP